MEIACNNENGAVVAELNGRMDATTAPEFDAWFSGVIQSGEPRLVLEFSKLEYVSSAGLRSLLAAAKQIKACQGTMVLCGLSGTVEEVFRISGFISIFQVYPTTVEALAAIS